MKTKTALTSILVIIYALSGYGMQLPPQGLENEDFPSLSQNRIEVRFAVGKKTITCKEFFIKAKIKKRKIISGKFASGFQIPHEAIDFRIRDAMSVEFKCAGHRWYFPEVGANAFSEGYWWVGASYPPFLEEFEGPYFKW
jgi:hypothetical protein